MPSESEELILEEYRRLASVLSPMDEFISRHQELTYIEFDYYTVNDLTLFAVEPNFDFAMLQATAQKITAALPALKRVFAKPIINLKDNSDVLPVETVHIINQATMQHLANHSDDVSKITRRGIKPRKLLTVIYEDDYGIYENLVFCNLIDDILRYVRQNMRSLRDLIYASEIMEFNLLERVNHMNYFLALGKLHTGYIRDFGKYYTLAKSLYVQLRSIVNSIQPYLKRPIYQKNKIRNRKLRLRKTNIFLMQKDYHQAYVLYKYLLNNQLTSFEKKEEKPDLTKLTENYFYFIQTLAIFSVGHFNFSINPGIKMNLKNLDSVFTFKKWSLNLKNCQGHGLLMSVTKDRTYKFLLIPSLSGEKEEDLAKLKKETEADEVLICSPFEGDYQTREEEFLSIENIDSFRRIQQLILKGMIYSDTSRDDCPFCQGTLSYKKKEDIYECENCRTQIKKGTCKENGEQFFYTEISALKKNTVLPSQFSKDEQWLYNRKVEGGMYFRNITKIDNQGQIICPVCHKPYSEKE